MGRTLLLAALVVTAVALVAIGAVPPAINYQGVLTDGSGTPVADGSYSITFNLYHQDSGGSPIWTQTSPVSVTGGIFNVYLGPIPLEFFEHFEYLVYLGLSIEGGPELTPRRPLVASPYALVAATVMDDAIHAFKIADGNVVRSLNGLTDDVNLVAGSNVTITPSGQDITISATGGGGGVGGTGTAGQVAFWSDPTTLTGVNELFWDDTNKRLGIGTPGPNARLRVESSERYTAVIANTYSGAQAQALRVNYTGTGTFWPTAIFAQSRPSDNIGLGGDFVGGLIGVRAFANVGVLYPSSLAYGVHAKAVGNESGNTATRCGVFAESYGEGASECYGIRAESRGATAVSNVGVYGYSTAGSNYRCGVYGIVDAGGSSYHGVVGEAPISGLSSAMWANGDLGYSGSLIGPPSDANLKKEVQPYQGALASIKQIEPKTFQYKTGDAQYEDINLAPGLHYGLVAQELENVLPELVVERVYPKSPGSNDAPGPPLKVKGIKYMELIPILLQAIKEQQATIEQQQKNIDDLETRMIELENN